MKKVVTLVVLVSAGVLIYKVATGGPYNTAKQNFAKEEYKLAALNFQKAIDQGEHVHESLVYLARIDGIKDDYEQGIARCNEAIEIAPNASQAYYFKAILLQLDGRMGQATSVLDELSNMPQIGKGFAIAKISNPRPGTHEALRPHERELREKLLKGQAY